MFDEYRYKETDEMMRSVLSQGQEEVPDRVWDGISSQLDKIEAASRRRTVMLWFRRTAVAAAAAVAVGVFIGRDGNGDIIPDTADRTLIAVAGTTEIHIAEGMTSPSLLAERRVRNIQTEEAGIMYETEAMETEQEDPESQNETVHPEGKRTEAGNQVKEDVWSDAWIEDEVPVKVRRKQETSIVLSGVAGTNSAQKSGLGLLRSPSMSTSKPKTGVEQKSSESTYGLPVSLGAGVRIGLNERWSLGVGANYTILTRKFFGTYTLVNSEGSIEESISSDIRNVQQYVGIPMNVYYNFISRDFLNFYAYAGATVERCVSDKYDILNTSYIHKGSVNGVQLSADIGLGMEFVLGRHLGIYLDPSLRYYFDCGQPKSIRTAQPLMLGFEAGLRIHL